jgi:predicted ArsR family transcriptional regulator
MKKTQHKKPATVAKRVIPYVSITGAATRLGIHESTVRYHMARGAMEYVLTADGTRLIPEAALKMER